VVATRAGGIPEMIEDGLTGLLVEPRDPVGLASGVLRLLRAPALAARLAEAGRQRVEARFSAQAMVTGNLGVYRELAG
jgi:glycosyltransferase involved in cell wall biosynthesis